MGKVMEELLHDRIEERVQQGRAEGMQQGMQQGMEKGKLSIMMELVKEGILPIAEAAKKVGMNEAAFRKVAAL